MKTDEQKYCDCMEEIKDRIGLLKALAAGKITTANRVFDSELAYLQFRKVLELIAFSSLIANKALYSSAHANFSNHWKAKDMLAAIEKLNANFYPVAVHPPEVQRDGTKRITPVATGFLTVGDFAALYDVSSEFLHVRNPFTSKDPNIKTFYPGKEWIARIRNLIALHVIHLVDGRKWIVQVPDSEPVHVFTAEQRR